MGGGTPSLLPEDELRALFETMERVTGFRASASEVTVECNPESLDRAKAALLLELGATRLSIGVQSLRPATLELFGRVHGAEDGLRAFRDAREAGARELSVDLIYASPDGREGEWEEDLARVLAERPEHFSAYNLTFEEDTLFRRWLDQGRLAPLPEERELHLFHATRALAGEHGYAAYEISNFALPGHECAHNVNYWRNGPYVGIGPSAVSCVDGRRAGNVRQLPAYRAAIAANGRAEAWNERLGPLARLGETWWLGLRRAEGVDPAEARATAGVEATRRPIVAAGAGAGGDPALETAERLLERGLLERSGARYRLSPRGLPLADAIAAEFLAAEPDATDAGDEG